MTAADLSPERHLAAIRRVGLALAARDDELAGAMVGRIVAEVPQYRRAAPRVAGDVRVLATATALATVISRPSRTQATPSATTIRVWNGDQGSRSSRLGTSVSIVSGAAALMRPI